MISGKIWKEKENNKMKKILLTGGAGFIGSHTIEHFLRNTDVEIYVIDRLSYAGNLNRLVEMDIWEKEKGRVHFVYHDFRSAFPFFVKKQLPEIEYIIHMGGETHVANSFKYPKIFLESNVIGTMNVLDLAREIQPSLFVYVSTDEVYGAVVGDKLHVEGEPHRPSNPYSASKSGGEAIVHSYWKSFGVPMIITNCFSMDTKLWTPKGMLNYEEIQEGDEVWSLNNNEELVKTKVLEKVRMPSNGKMIHFKANRVDQLVTPNHRMMVRIPHNRPREYGAIEERLAETLLNEPRFRIPLTGKWNGNEYNPTNFLSVEWLAKILGWYVSEGYTTTGNGVCFGAGGKEQQQELIKLLQEENLSPYINGRSVRVHNKELSKLGKLFGKRAVDKHLPEFIKEWNPHLLNLFLEAAIAGDGSRYGTGAAYYTKSKILSWEMCEIAIKAGWSAKISERKTWNPLKTKMGLSYIVRISHQQGTLGKINVTEEEYNEDVWCIRTETGKVFPYRNGTISLSGQTMNNFGQRQDPEKFVPKTMLNILQNKTVDIHCAIDSKNGKVIDISSRCWLHARNHADALLFLLEHSTIGERYNVVGERRNVYELAEMIAMTLGKKNFNYDYIPFHSYSPGHDMHYGLDGTKMKELGWIPPVPFENSLEKTVQWTKDNPKWLGLD